MRDRLSSLRSLHSLPGTTGQLEGGAYAQAAGDWSRQTSLEEEEGPMEEAGLGAGPVEEVLEEAQEVRREVQMLRLDVKRLREQNARLLSEPYFSGELQRDSNGIGGDIKTRGQDTLARLRKMDAHARELEDEHGVNSAVARIARTQYACLSNGFRDAMADYNAAEMSHRDTCKAHIQRQMEIVGRDVSGEQIEEMLEGGRWNVFADNVQSEGKTARSALGQIERRHQELLELESRVRSVHEVFLDVAMLVEEQGPMLDAIHTHVQKTDVATGDALLKIQTAKKHDKNNPLKKLFFWKR
ncbi:syntaxin-11-like [Alosa sapidissima]|uniref:syntaxin-11-like n=1 Tax=Alosa sapidissima TaxID=34773 RepID=UPI001C08898B|nr:syntaxin-11-like [Alosa sapidissima]